MTRHCPKCGFLAYIKQGTQKTNKGIAYRVKCKKCGCKFTLNPTAINNPSCPYCASKSVAKRGKTSNGAQKYRCNSCNKHFLDKTEKPRLSDNLKKKILGWYLGGFGCDFLAEYFKVGKVTVYRIVNKYKESRRLLWKESSGIIKD